MTLRGGATSCGLLLAVSLGSACRRSDPGGVAPAPSISAPDTSTPTPPTAKAAPEPTVDPTLFARDQIFSSGLVAWRGGAVTLSSPLMFVDADQRLAKPLEIPDCASIWDVSSTGERDLALCARRRGDVAVFSRDAKGTKWFRVTGVSAKDGANAEQWRPGPAESGFRVAARADTLVVWEPTRLHVRKGDADFRRVAIPAPAARPLRPFPSSVILGEDRFFLAYSAGEFGGALLSVDLGTGAVRTEPAGEMTNQPVTGNALDARDQIWVARGQSHIISRKGSLHRQVGDVWQLVASCDAHAANPQLARVGWNLEPSAFEGLAFDASGLLYMLSPDLGLVRRAPDGVFTRLTHRWPRHVFVDGLVIRNEQALIGTLDSGVLLVDLKTGALDQVTLGPRVSKIALPAKSEK